MASRLRFIVALPLIIFSLRRVIFTITALLTPARRPPTPPEPLPDLLVLIPCRNDGQRLADLIAALLGNGYPLPHLRICIIDDGSSDASPLLAQQLAEKHADAVRLVRLSVNQGKAAALNAALAAEPWGDIIAVYDADHRPQPGALSDLVAAFSDAQVAAVSLCTEASNALSSPSAYYSAIERLVHQRITLVANDRLSLAPAILGSHCAYRRSVLADLGGFAPGAFLEDSDLTVRMIAAGHRTRFLEATPAFDDAPASIAAYWRQHVRWGRGFNDVATKRTSLLLRPSLRPALRLELLLFSLGYFDRLALLAALGLIASDRVFHTRFRFPIPLLTLALTLPYVQVLAALWRTRCSRAWWLRLPYMILIFPIDLLAAVRSALDTVLRRPRRWLPTRAATPDPSHALS